MQDDFEDIPVGDMSNLDIPWYKKMILKFFPHLFLKWHAGHMNIDDKMISYAQNLFADKKIHIQPLSGVSGRGFIIFVDNKISFWFFQDENHFVYDGFEMGEYDDGDVTVFDSKSE